MKTAHRLPLPTTLLLWLPMGDGAGVECCSACPLGLLLCSGQFFNQAEDVIGREFAVIAPLEAGDVGHLRAGTIVIASYER